MFSLGFSLTSTTALGRANFSPLALFTAGEQGFIYDPSDFSTLYRDNAGTTPVTAVGQTVGLVLDKSRGLVLGDERLSNGDFSSGSTGWTVANADATHIVTFANGAMRYQSDTTTPQLLVTQANAMEIGKWYKVTVVCSAWTSGSLKTDVGNGSPVLASGLGTFVTYVLANSTTLAITRNTANVDLTIDNISVRELPGNHATQSVLASRPILQQDANGKFYLLFDGSDDFLVTPTITPGTDKAQVFAGVRKLSDAARAALVDFGGGGNGFFNIESPSNASNPDYAFRSTGTLAVNTNFANYPAPITNIVTGLGDISGDRATLRVNGAQVGQSTGDQGTGNYLAYPAYIGRRGGTTLPFNGRLYGLIARFGPNLSDVQTAQTEQWLNQKTGAF